MDELNTDGSLICLLPRETVDNIFDHLYNDIPTLSASSLVCRAWIPSCRYHLFYTLKCNAGTDSRGAISHLHEWLLASPEVHPYIQTLNVVRRWGGCRDIYVEDVEQVLHCLPFLRNLTLVEITIRSRDTSADVSYVSSTGRDRRLRSLVILKCSSSADAPQPLCRILGLFAEVDRLAILGSVIGWEPNAATVLSRTSSHLLELAHRFRVSRELRIMPNDVPGELELLRFLVDHSVHGDDLDLGIGWPIRELWLKPATLQLQDNGAVEAPLIRQSRNTLRSIFLDFTRAVRNDYQLRGDYQGWRRANGLSEYCSTLCLGECSCMESLYLQFTPAKNRRPLPRLTREIFISCLSANTEIVKHAPSSVKMITLAFPVQAAEGGKYSDLYPWDISECSQGWQIMDATLTQRLNPTIVQVVLVESAMGIMRCMHSTEHRPGPRIEIIDAEGEGLAHQPHACWKQLLPRSYARGVVRIYQEREI